MRKTITLLLLALLTSVGAWAETEVTETYDFGAFITANGTGNLTVSGDGIAQTGTSAKVGTVKVINNLVVGSQTLDLKGRFAVDYQYNAGAQIRFMWRSSSNAYQHGLAGQWNGNGTADAQGAARFSVLNLKAGDKITFTYAKQSGRAADPYTCAAGAITVGETSVGVDAALASGTEYTVVADGNLDLYFTNNNFAISKIVIKTTSDEDVTAPTYAVTGVDGEARKFTLACATTGASIFYSDKELEAGAEGWTAYEGVVTTNATKIYAYASANGAKSEVINFETGAGSKLTLNAPYANKTAYANGSYTVSIGSNQSSLSFAPSTVTYHYSIDGAAYVEGATATLPAGSTLTAYAAAEGYTTSSITTCEASIRPTVVQVWTQDYTNLVSGSTGAQAITLTETEGGDFTVGDRAFYNITGYTGTEISELNTNVGLNTASYFYLRTNGNNSGILKNANNGGSTGYIGIQNLKPGQYIVITTNGNPLSATEGCEDNLGMNTTSEYYFKATATEASIFFQHGTYNYVKSIAVYNEVETVTVAEEGTSTYVTTAALDFSDVEGLTVLIATKETQGYVELSKVTQVPAGAPIIVKGEAGDYSVPVCDATTYSDNLTNKLSGSATASYTVTADDNIYAIKKDKSEFRPVAAGVEIPAKKAYFRSEYPINADAKPFIIRGEEEDPTAVSTVEVVEAAKAKKFFNAAGQQVDENYKGFVITSAGKKIINK